MVVPKCPQGFQWVNTSRDNPYHRMDSEPSVAMRLTLELFENIVKEYPVDLKRIYTVGFSMGGFAVWDILQRKPDLFAAAIPVCGGGDDTLAMRIKNVSIWAFHGEKDEVAPPARTRNMISALNELGGRPLYTEYKNTGHNSWTKAFRDEEVISWLLDKRK